MPITEKMIKTSQNARRFRGAVNFIFIARQKFGRKFDYSKVDYSTNNKKVCIVCNEHGEFWQTPSSHIRSVCGCTKCGEKKAIISNLKIYTTDKKCNACKKTFSIDKFRTCNAKKKNGRVSKRISPYCIDCDRERDKEKSKTRDKEKIRLAYVKYRATDKGKKKAEEIKEKARKKYRSVYFRKCSCGKIEVLKNKPKRLDICDNCYSKETYNKNRDTKNRICIDCNVLFDGFNGVKRCDNCNIEHKKKQKRKARKLRKAKERGAKIGIAFDPIDVFKRDKWKCKMCGCKVQKKDIYKDNAAEIDHVIPISKGGLHIPSNVQTLCRACNSNKSDKLVGQASLFGRTMF